MQTRIERLRVGPLGENVYAIVSSGVGVLVDPGDDAPAILDFLARTGIEPAVVVLTHGHLDHCGALPELLEAWKGRSVAVAIHPDDARYLGARSRETNESLFAAIGATGYFLDYWHPLPEPDILLAEGDAVPGTSLLVLHTPGHSAGSICLHDAGAGLLVSGDTLFRDGVGRSDGPDSDVSELERSLDRLAALPGETVVFPGHGPRTTIAREFGRS